MKTICILMTNPKVMKHAMIRSYTSMLSNVNFLNRHREVAKELKIVTYLNKYYSSPHIYKLNKQTNSLTW